LCYKYQKGRKMKNTLNRIKPHEALTILHQLAQSDKNVTHI
jgi:hypothetical protein